MPASSEVKKTQSTGRPRPQDVDRHVGLKLRERRMLLGLTQQQMAELIGVTYQQAHKYEKGINRIAGGRLHAVARALGVEVNYFFEDISTEGGAFRPTAKQRLLLEFTRDFMRIADRRHQEAICSLARALASSELASEPERDEPAARPKGHPRELRSRSEPEL